MALIDVAMLLLEAFSVINALVHVRNSRSSGKKVLNIATDIAACNFNDGLKNVLRIMQILKIEIGAQSYNFCVESDAKRIQYAERALTDAAKEARFNLPSSRKENKEEYMNTKGRLYGTGIAD